MKRWLALLVVIAAGTGAMAFAEEASPISPARYQKLLKFIDTLGAKEEFPAPTAQNLGLSDDANKALPVVSVVTGDRRVYFCRSQLDPSDYIVWFRINADTSYMFSTHPDFKLLRALQLKANSFPQSEDVNAAEIRTKYREALEVLAKDLDKSASP